MARLKVGDRAPDFSATTFDGKTIRLSDFIGKRGVVIFFYPRDGSPVCTKEACSFRDSYERFREAGVEVIGVSGNSAESHRAFAEHNRLSFPLISDKGGAIRQAFGVPPTLGLIPRRVTYVIDREGIVRLAYSALFASQEHVDQAQQIVDSFDRGLPAS